MFFFWAKLGTGLPRVPPTPLTEILFYQMVEQNSGWNKKLRTYIFYYKHEPESISYFCFAVIKYHKSNQVKSNLILCFFWGAWRGARQTQNSCLWNLKVHLQWHTFSSKATSFKPIPKQCHQLRTKYLNAWDHGGHLIQTTISRLVLNSWFSCFPFPRAEIKGICLAINPILMTTSLYPLTEFFSFTSIMG